MKQTQCAGLLLALAGLTCGAQTAPGTAPSAAANAPVTLRVDLGREEGALVPVWNWFGYDESNYTTTAHGRQLLGELHDLSPVPVYVRAHHLLTSSDGASGESPNGVPELKWSSSGVYHEDAKGRAVYDFHLLDGIFDAYKAAGVRPMVELGFMPEDLAARLPNKPGQPYQVHFGHGDTTAGSVSNPPKDYGRWQALVEAVTAHLVARYGAETVRGWPFEVWNEPDIDYWHGTPEEYWKLYDFAVAGVRAALPGAMVGGPASTGPNGKSGGPFLQGFLTHVDTGRSAVDGGPVPLNFISFHAKGHPTFAAGPAEGQGKGQVTMGLRSELEDADRGFAIVAAHPRLKSLPIILSEADPEGCAACSSKQNPANNYRNGTLYPTYTAAAYKALRELARQHGVRLEAMLSWSFEFEGRDYFEGFRSLATNGIDKPVLNVFRMLGLMEGRAVAVDSTGRVPLEALLAAGTAGHSDVDALASRGDHAATVLLWNYADLPLADLTTDVDVQLTGLPAGVQRVLVQQYRIDDHHSNAYRAWQAMGSPQAPTAAQLATLKERSGLELFGSPAWKQVQDGRLGLAVTLPGESVALVVARW